jgi:hypothetical protein
LGEVKAGPAFDQTNNFLNLSIFPGPSGKQIMTFPVTEKYDRIEITMGGLAEILGRLRVYDIKRKLITPRVLIDPITTDKRTICEGTQTTFSIDNPQECTDYKWFSQETGGSPLATGLTYTTSINLPAGEYNFYVQASRTYCVNAISERLRVKLKVKPYAAVPVIVGLSVMCSGTSTTIATIDATGIVTAIATGSVVISYTVADDATYCGKKVDFNLMVNPLPNLTLGPDPSICKGLTTTKITYSNLFSDPITYSISWTGGLLTPVSDQTLPANEITITIPSTTPVDVYQGILTIKNANGCERAIPFSFRVKLVPHKPIVSIN